MEIKISLVEKLLSVNKAWQGRRFKSSEYLALEELLMLLLPRKTMIKGYVEIEYHFFLKNWKMVDVDNLVKPLQDIIVKKGYIEDDRQIKKITAEKHQAEKDSFSIWIKKI